MIRVIANASTAALGTSAWQVQRTNQPLCRFDPRGDVLYIDLGAASAPANAELDEEEIFVFRNTTNGVVTGYAVTAFTAHWQFRLNQLLEHLSTYTPEYRAALSTAFATRTQSQTQAPLKQATTI